MIELEDLEVLVLGLGDSGLAMARWCAARGARVRVWDSRAAPPQGETLAREVPQAQRLAGDLCADTLGQARLVLKSPGLAPHDARIAPLLDAARARGIAIGGELELFIAALAQLKTERAYAPKVLAITGTNGKTTTTAMTAMLVERAGLAVTAAGNIGPTMLDTLRLALAGDAAGSAGLPQVWVLELSSFQLDGVQGFEADAAAVLNLTQDHLDWHGTIEAYAAAKARIFGSRATMVVNRDDPAVEAMASAATSVISARGKTRTIERDIVRFGLDAPRRGGDFGIVVDHGVAWLVRAIVDTEPTRPRAKAAEIQPLQLQRLMPADALRVRGRHNAANALAALALATSIGCPLSALLHALREYRGEPHRVEFVARVGEVEAFDDSKGTNVGATVAALEGLGADRAPAKLAVILGGEGKGQDFAPLLAPLARHARAVALIGRDAATLESVLGAAARDAGVVVQRHDTLEAAVAWCFERSRPGDAVLLSPACASLDMFRNYAHRAEAFVAAVHAIAAAQGELT